MTREPRTHSAPVKPVVPQSDIVKMVELVSILGPDIPEMAKRLGRHRETVRYWYRQKLLDKGFAVQVGLNYEKLGLRRVAMVLDFAEEYREHAQPILWAMSELCYVTYFNKTLPAGLYIVHASVPTEYVDSFLEMVSKLKDKGMFVSANCSVFEWYRNVPMNAGFYDFDRGRWDFDWSNQAAAYDATLATSEPGRFDELDLRILKELQYDANTLLTEIGDKLKINYKTLTYRYRKHIVEQGLIKNYRLNWLGTRYDYNLDKAMNRKHYYLIMNVIFRDLTEVERMRTMEMAHRLPFLWAEACGPSSYYSEFAFPTEHVPEVFLYLEQLIAPLKGRGEAYVVDQTSAILFSISPQLYDDEQKRWRFNQKDMLSRFDQLILKIKEGTG